MSVFTNFDPKTLSEPGYCAIIGQKSEGQSALLFDLLESCRDYFSRIYIFTSSEQTATDFIDEELKDIYFYGSLNPLKRILDLQAIHARGTHNLVLNDNLSDTYKNTKTRLIKEGRCRKPIAVVFACSIAKNSFHSEHMRSLCFYSRSLDIRSIFLGCIFDFPPQLRMNFTEIFFMQDSSTDVLYKTYFQELTKLQFDEIFATETKPNQALDRKSVV